LFSVKILSSKVNRSDIFRRSMLTITKFLKRDLSREVNIISDNSSIEIISSSLLHNEEDIANTGAIVAELLIKKTIIISNEDLRDRDSLDKYLSEIKHFCEQAVKVEDVTYLPPHLRELK
jgi:hypothetical protein